MTDHFQDQSCPLHTLPGYISILEGIECSEITQSNLENVMQLLRECAPFYFDGKLTAACTGPNHCPDVTSKCLTHNAVYKILHYLVDSGFMEDGNLNMTRIKYSMMIFPQEWNVTEQAFVDWFFAKIIPSPLSNNLVHIPAYIFRYNATRAVLDEYVFLDLPWYGLAMALVVIILLLYLRSIALMITVVLNVGCSLALTYFFYFVVCRFEFFPFVCLTAGLLLIAVGADDVFIIHDIWEKFRKESGSDFDIVELTSRTLRHGALSVLVTSLTTSAALFANYYSDITAIQTFGVFSGLCILANFCFMITWVPPVLVLMERFDANFCTSCKWECYRKLTAKMARASDFIWGTFAPFVINKLFFIWIPLFLALGVGSFIVIFVTPKLRLPTTDQVHFLYESHPFEQYNWIYKDYFRFQITGNAEDFIKVRWIFGIDGKDKGNHLNPDDLGSLRFLDNFNLYTEDSQTWMLQFCEDLLNEEYIHSDEDMVCLFTRYKQLVEDSCHEDRKDTCCNESFPLEDARAEECFTDPYFLKELTSPPNSTLLGTLFYDQSSRMTAMRYETVTTFQITVEYEKMGSIYNKFISFLTRVMDKAPDELQGAGFTSDQLWYYDLQKALAEGTYYGILLSLAIGIPVLLVTSLNAVITIYAVVTILFVIASTIASMVLLGWELNGGEALTITLSVGLSIDFAIHFGVAFKLSKKTTRTGRVTETMHLVGSAVTMAALTTFVSGASLLQGRILFYQRFGVFLMMVMVMSWGFSNFFFMSICRLIGPLRNIGDITVCCREKCKKTPEITNGEHNTINNIGDVSIGKAAPNWNYLANGNHVIYNAYEKHIGSENKAYSEEEMSINF